MSLNTICRRGEGWAAVGLLPGVVTSVSKEDIMIVIFKVTVALHEDYIAPLCCAPA